jgi:hypothetical protein
MAIRNLVLADPALLARTTFGWGTAGAILEQFVADNVQWDGLAYWEPDFDVAEDAVLEQFDVPPWEA